MCAESLISVVDDDESVRQALDGLLRSAGLRVAAFASARPFSDRKSCNRPNA
jgi:FixJ family two-component response regulator